MKPLKEMTNVEFVEHIMSFNPRGALVQPFVIQALEYYCRVVANADLKDFGDFINPDAWRECAAHVQLQLEAKYGNQKDQVSRSS